MVPAFGLNNLSAIRILVDLDGTSLALRAGSSGLQLATNGARVRIQDRYDIAQVLVVLLHERLELFLKLYLTLEAGVVLEGLEVGKLFLKCLFRSTKLSKFRNFIFL